MTVPQQTDVCINLESLSLDELDRTVISTEQGEDSTATGSGPLQGPHAGQRCNTADRELLRNRFPDQT